MKFLSIALACLLMQTASAQNFPNIYRDVIELRKTMSGNGFKTDTLSQKIYLPILSRYFSFDETDQLAEVKIKMLESNNPFGISEMLPENTYKELTQAEKDYIKSFKANRKIHKHIF